MNSNTGIFNKNRFLAALNIKTQNYGLHHQDDFESLLKKIPAMQSVLYLPTNDFNIGDPQLIFQISETWCQNYVFLSSLSVFFFLNFSSKTSTKLTFVTQIETDRDYYFCIFFFFFRQFANVCDVDCALLCVFFTSMSIYTYIEILWKNLWLHIKNYIPIAYLTSFYNPSLLNNFIS